MKQLSEETQHDLREQRAYLEGMIEGMERTLKHTKDILDAVETTLKEEKPEEEKPEEEKPVQEEVATSQKESGQ